MITSQGYSNMKGGLEGLRGYRARHGGPHHSSDETFHPGSAAWEIRLHYPPWLSCCPPVDLFRHPLAHASPPPVHVCPPLFMFRHLSFRSTELRLG